MTLHASPIIHHITSWPPGTEDERARQLLRIEQHLAPPHLHNADEAALAARFRSGELDGNSVMDGVSCRMYLQRN